jgi:hypothetical protein
MASTTQKAIIGGGIVAAAIITLWFAGPIWSRGKLPPPQVLQQRIVQSDAPATAAPAGGKSAGGVAARPTGSTHNVPSHSSGTAAPNSGPVGPDQQPAEPDVVDPSAREAARALLQHGKAARGVAGRTLEQYRGNDPEVLIPLIQATAKAGDWESVPRLVELMEHPDVRVRGKAGAAVRIIMGADYGFRAEDPPHKRREAIKLINQIYPTMKNKLQQHYGSTSGP